MTNYRISVFGGYSLRIATVLLANPHYLYRVVCNFYQILEIFKGANWRRSSQMIS